MKLGNFFARFSIRKQILIGFAPFLMTLILLVIISNNNFNNFFMQSKKLKLATDETTLLLEIEKDMLGLQRNVLVYSYIGYAGVINKIRFLERGIEARLETLEGMKKEDGPEAIDRFNRLKHHYKGYKDGFEDTIYKRNELTTVMNKEALPTHQKLQKLIQGIISRSNQKGDYKSAILAYEISRNLLQVRFNLGSFLSAPDASLIEGTKSILKQVSQNTKLLKKRLGVRHVNAVESLLLSFEHKFLEMVNINRNYLALINVVLPGKASEINKLTKELDALEKAELEAVNKIITADMHSSKDNYILLSLLAAMIGVISSSLISSSISGPVKKITEILTRLAKGDKEIDIPGLSRADEVGEMAIAANNFKTMARNLGNRTQELQIANYEATKAKEQAEHANHTKGDFLAIMSHEIRTPMNGIFGMGELIVESGLDTQQKEYMQILMNSAESLLVILDDVLDFSKIDAGKLELDPVPVNLRKLMEEATDILVIKAEEKGIEILMKYDDDVPVSVIADPVRVRQILTNLISNSIKFTNKGYISLRAENLTGDDIESSTAYIKISIEDTGIGIPIEHQNKLFDKFTQADTSTTRKFGGTGLGLAICKQLAELMDGKMGLSSVDAEGSVFWFTMLLEVSEQEDIPDEEHHTDEEIANIHFDGAKILIAEDNAVNQEIVKEILTRAGCEVHVAINGEQAVRAAFKDKYDLILMDCQMPIMDGFEASRKLSEAKANKTIDNIPIIALTANVMKGDKDACLEAGMQDYIPKPVRKKLIIEMLDKWLNHPHD